MSVGSSQLVAVTELLAGSLSTLQTLLIHNLRPHRARPNNTKIDSTLKDRNAPVCSTENVFDVGKLLASLPEIEKMAQASSPPEFDKVPTFASCLGKIEPELSKFDTFLGRNARRNVQRGKLVPVWFNGNLSLSLNCRSGEFHVQRRGFRTRSTHTGVMGSRKDLQNQSFGEKTRFSLGNILDIVVKGKKPENLEENQAMSRLLSSDEMQTEESKKNLKIEEAKEEVMEIVEYLRDPDKFSRLGGRLPKGILLVGQPGCGKTLLARAIAGEAGVPFFHASGSEFDEVLVGQGAKRVRDLFAQAKARAPAVIFIDEVDSVGAKRVSTAIHPYANQTINQLLNEMDGFQKNEGIIVLAATNRRDDLDKALLRPGRFDVEVTIPIPDLRGRKEILKLYLDKIVTNPDLDMEVLAKGTTGFTGADIENMVNQAALRAAADGMVDVSMNYLEGARDKVLMGPERKHRIPDEEANRNTAYHEAGHTLVAFYTKDATPLHKVTIVPRGHALGMTQMLPDKDSYQLTRSQLLAQMDVAMGGRAAEELILGTEKVTTGAANDLQGATSLATQMVKTFGMSDKVGLRKFEEGGGQSIFFPASEQISEVTSDAIDSEIKRLLHESFERAKDILKSHSKELKRLAENLLDRETLSADEIRKVVEGKSLD